jgi:hypothetical protein
MGDEEEEQHKGEDIEEMIMAIFPIVMKEDLSSDACDLVITTNRLIVVRRNKLGPQSPKYLYVSASTCERLKMNEVLPENILKADSRNFEIAYWDLPLIEVKDKDFFVYIGDTKVPKYRFTVERQYLHDLLKHTQFINSYIGDLREKYEQWKKLRESNLRLSKAF